MHHGLGQAVAFQFTQVVQRALAAGQHDEVRFLQLIRPVGVIQVHPVVAFQAVEIREVRQVEQLHHGHVHPSRCGTVVLLFQFHGILLLNLYVVEIRYHPEYRHAAHFLHHPHAVVEQPAVAPEFVDDDALYPSTVFRRLQHDGTVSRSENPAPVDVRHQKHVGPGMAGHGHIHDVAVPQVDFGDAAGPLHHDGVVTDGEPVERCTHHCPQLLASAPAEVVVSRTVAHGPPVEHHLRRMVGIRFEQHGIHVRVARYAGRFGLHGLRPPYLKPFGSGVRIERHVLCLERSRAVTVLPENAAQSRCQYALAHVAPRTGQHERM